jgi:hypothetical protein
MDRTVGSVALLDSLFTGHDGVTLSLSGVTGFLPRLLMVARTLYALQHFLTIASW